MAENMNNHHPIFRLPHVHAVGNRRLEGLRLSLTASSSEEKEGSMKSDEHAGDWESESTVTLSSSEVCMVVLGGLAM